MQQKEQSRTLAGFGAKSARISRLRPFTAGTAEDEIDNDDIEAALASSMPGLRPTLRQTPFVVVGPFGRALRVDPAPQGQILSDDPEERSGCHARALVIFAPLMFLAIAFGASLVLAADGLTRYEAHLAAEARI